MIRLYDLRRSDCGRAYLVEVGQIGKESDKVYFTDPVKVSDMCRTELEMHHFAEEVLYLFAVDTKLTVIGAFMVTKGTARETIASPREVFIRALLIGATGVVLVHNHPSGDPTPSEEDRKTTEEFKAAGNLLGIELIDHIVVAAYGYYSFSSQA